MHLSLRAPWRVLVVMVTAMSLVLLTTSHANAATTQSVIPSPGRNATIQQVEQYVASQPASSTLTKNEIHGIALSVVDIGREIARHTNSDGTMQPNWSMGFGWLIYIHHITPTEQRWFLQVGVGTVAAVICFVSGGAACAISTIAANIIITTVAEYYSTTFCLEVQLTYQGYFHNAYRTRC